MPSSLLFPVALSSVFTVDKIGLVCLVLLFNISNEGLT